MSEQPTPDPASASAMHETTDVQSRPMVLSALVLAVAVALVCAFLIWFVRRLEGQAKRHDPQLSPLIGSQSPPAPRLQDSPADDLVRLRAAESRALSGYRWIDKERGVVQLPIDRAMDLLLEEGLPETKADVPRVESEESKEQKEAQR